MITAMAIQIRDGLRATLGITAGMGISFVTFGAAQLGPEASIDTTNAELAQSYLDNEATVRLAAQQQIESALAGVTDVFERYGQGCMHEVIPGSEFVDPAYEEPCNLSSSELEGATVEYRSAMGHYNAARSYLEDGVYAWEETPKLQQAHDDALQIIADAAKTSVGDDAFDVNPSQLAGIYRVDENGSVSHERYSPDSINITYTANTIFFTSLPLLLYGAALAFKGYARATQKLHDL